MSRAPFSSIKASLIDLSGTLHIEDEATPNAIAALNKLREGGIALKFVTNTTKESSGTLYQRLCKIGFALERHEIYSSLSAAATYVQEHALNPYYLVSEDARTDFPPADEGRPCDAVVVGLAPDEFHYKKLNSAFNVLMANKDHRLIAIHQGKYYKRSDGLALGPGCFVKGLEYATGAHAVLIGKPNRVLMANKDHRLIAIHQGKYYKRSDGLALGPGCFVKGLEYATGAQAVLIGKPNRYFFESAIPPGIDPKECVMIGDDPTDDVAGAMKAGLKGILVKTGKYLPHVVVDPPPTVLVENFSEAVDWILQQNC